MCLQVRELTHPSGQTTPEIHCTPPASSREGSGRCTRPRVGLRRRPARLWRVRIYAVTLRDEWPVELRHRGLHDQSRLAQLPTGIDVSHDSRLRKGSTLTVPVRISPQFVHIGFGPRGIGPVRGCIGCAIWSRFDQAVTSGLWSVGFLRDHNSRRRNRKRPDNADRVG
jgi:hypothetical protein